MYKRIRYSLTLMSICILGVILTQGYWLYKDYNYYRGQPLFSADFNFYSRIPAMSARINGISPRIIELPSIIAYSSSPLEHTLSPDTVSLGKAHPMSVLLPADFATTRFYPVTNSNVVSKAAIHDTPGSFKRAVPAVPAFTVNPELYKTIPYQAPLTHILQKMKWQFGASILLVLFTISCFIYTLVTIFMQRKLSTSKNEFINNMTHELKTPLATVSVAIEAMRDFGVLEDKMKTNLYLDISKKELDHLSKMIEMIMQLSVYESYKMELILKKHHINALIENVVEKYVLSKSKRLSLSVVQEDTPFYFLIDATHISNALRNLIDNSIKYSNPGVEITIRSRFENENWLLSVEDNGFGISKKYHKDIFERFFRITDGDKPIVKGFGLGLSYVKQVVELHGGDISVQSQEGKGTIFLISIPLTPLI